MDGFSFPERLDDAPPSSELDADEEDFLSSSEKFSNFKKLYLLSKIALTFGMHVDGGTLENGGDLNVFFVTALPGLVQRGLSVLVSQIWVSAFLQQKFDDLEKYHQILRILGLSRKLKFL